MTVMEALREAIAAATPGPWDDTIFDEFLASVSAPQARRDAELVVLLRNHADALLAVVEAPALRETAGAVSAR